MGTDRNYLSDAAISILKSNRYVKNVSKSTVQFTSEFKELFYERHQNGEIARDIFESCGIDPDILGERRITGFCHTVNTLAKEGKGFDSKKKESVFRKKSTQVILVEELQELKNQLAYTKQEVEFLKKIQMANTEARKEWESKQNQK